MIKSRAQIDSFDLFFFEKLIKELKEDQKQTLWIVGNNLRSSKSAWKKIQAYIDTEEIKPLFVSNNYYSLDGWNPFNASIILIDGWQENRNAGKLMRDYIPLAKQCREIGDIPSLVKGE